MQFLKDGVQSVDLFFSFNLVQLNHKGKDNTSKRKQMTELYSKMGCLCGILCNKFI